jgi:hypothetical protein
MTFENKGGSNALFSSILFSRHDEFLLVFSSLCSYLWSWKMYCKLPLGASIVMWRSLLKRTKYMDNCSIIDLYSLFNLYTKKKDGQCNVEPKLRHWIIINSKNISTMASWTLMRTTILCISYFTYFHGDYIFMAFKKNSWKP